jgi:hypothetical protein
LLEDGKGRDGSLLITLSWAMQGRAGETKLVVSRLSRIKRPQNGLAVRRYLPTP